MPSNLSRFIRSILYKRSAVGNSIEPKRPPPAAIAAQEIDRLALPFDESRKLLTFRELAGTSSPEIEGYLQLYRRIILLNVLHFRARAKDLALAAVLVAYDRLLSEGEVAEYDPLVHAERVILRVEAAASSAPGAALAAELGAQSEEAARLIDEAKDHAALLMRFRVYVANSFGDLELATRANYDEAAYLSGNPDVASSIERGNTGSGWDHFLRYGENEGRLQRRYNQIDGVETLSPQLTFNRCMYSSTHVGDDQEINLVSLQRLVDPRDEAEVTVAVLCEAENHNAAISLDLSKSVGQSTRHFQQLVNQSAWRASELYIAGFKNALADIQNGLIIYDEKRIWGDSAFATLLNEGGRRRLPDFLLLDANYRRILKDAPKHVDGPLLLATSWASRANYGHWLMNTLFSVYLAREEVEKGHLNLLCPPLPDNLRSQLREAGAPPSSIVEVDARWVACEHLLYPSPLATVANMQSHSASRDFFAFLRERFHAEPDAEQPELVFVARGNFPSMRRMVNEDALFSALAPFGFVRIAPHELDLAGQIHAFSRARIVVGQFGAALWNTAFTPPGSRLVEIATTNYASNEYLYAAHLGGRSVSRVMLPVSGSSGGNDHGVFEFSAPVDEIAALVRELL